MCGKTMRGVVSAAVKEEVGETAKGGTERDAAQAILGRNVCLRPCRQIGRVQIVVTDTELIGEVRGKEMGLAEYAALGDVGIGTVRTEPAAIQYPHWRGKYSTLHITHLQPHTPTLF